MTSRFTPVSSRFTPASSKSKEIQVGSPRTPILVKSAEVANLSPKEQGRVLELKKQLNSLEPMSLLDFGKDLHAESDKVADDLVKHSTIGELGEIGTRMTEIMQRTQSVNVDLLRKPESRIPLFGKLINRIRNAKGKVQAQYTEVSTYVAGMVTEVDVTCKNVHSNIVQLERLYKTTEQMYKEVSLHMIALKARHEEVTLETDAFEKGLTIDSDPFDHQQVADARRYLEQVEQTYANFKAISISALHTAKGVRATQQNSVTIVDKFGMIKKFTFPTWKTKFAVQLAMEGTLEAAELANTIDDANNQLARDTATMLKVSSIAVAKTSQRGVYDLETLEFVQQEIVTAAQEVRSIVEEGTKQRQELIARAEQMKLELLTTTTTKEVK